MGQMLACLQDTDHHSKALLDRNQRIKGISAAQSEERRASMWPAFELPLSYDMVQSCVLKRLRAHGCIHLQTERQIRRSCLP